MRGRFAPSPTGDLHLGGAATALASWLVAKAASGTWLVRVEDLDPPRVVAGATARILDDLEWLGLGADEGPRVEPWQCGPYEQSRRGALYDAAIDLLDSRGLVYRCTCSRAEVARAASAPHGPDGPRYPGTCRDRVAGDRPAALRLRLPTGAAASFHDRFGGAHREDVAAVAGDFVLRRADGIASYQLAVVVDDLAMGIDHVIRGADLFGSTGRQIVLASLLTGGARPIQYGHLPLVCGPDGERLAKRHQSNYRGSTIQELRAANVSSGEVLAVLGRGLGLGRGVGTVRLEALLEEARSRPLVPGAWQVPAAWIARREP